MNLRSSNDDFDDELLSAYVDDELTAAERARVEERLKSDPRAVALVEELRSLSSAVRSLPIEKLPRDLRKGVLAGVSRRADDREPVVLAMPTSSERWAMRRRGLIWSAIAIAAVLLLSITQPPVDDEGEVARRSAEPAAGGNSDNDQKRELFESPADADRPVRFSRESPSLSAPAAPAAAPTVGEERASGRDDEADEVKLDALVENESSRAESAVEPRKSLQPAAAPEQSGDAASSLSLSETYSPAGQAGGVGGEEKDLAAMHASGGAAASRKVEDIARAPAAPRVVKITMARSDAVSRFKQLLVDSKIAVSGDKALAGAASGERLSDLSKIAEAEEILVEASPAQVDHLLLMCRGDKAFAHVAPEGELRSDRLFAEAAPMRSLGMATEQAAPKEAQAPDSEALIAGANPPSPQADDSKNKVDGAKTPASDSYAYGTPASAAASSPAVGATALGSKLKDASGADQSTRRFVLFRFLPVATPAAPAAASPAAK